MVIEPTTSRVLLHRCVLYPCATSAPHLQKKVANCKIALPVMPIGTKIVICQTWSIKLRLSKRQTLTLKNEGLVSELLAVFVSQPKIFGRFSPRSRSRYRFGIGVGDGQPVPVQIGKPFIEAKSSQREREKVRKGNKEKERTSPKPKNNDSPRKLA